MDVVYLVKSSSENDELRHSLRSLRNLPHDRVFFAGYKPQWVTNVEHIPTVQLAGMKHPNSMRNQRAALLDPRVSDPFILMNDDHFVMQPQSQMPILNWGKVRDVLENCKTLGQTFQASMQYTEKLCHSLGHMNPLSYQLHVPLVIHKSQLLDVFDRFENTAPVGIWIQYVTITGNEYAWGGETYNEDVKIYDPLQHVTSKYKSLDFLSTTDRAFQYGFAGSYIRGKFRKKSPYEV